jgi:hypothetical protein
MLVASPLVAVPLIRLRLLSTGIAFFPCGWSSTSADLCAVVPFDTLGKAQGGGIARRWKREGIFGWLAAPDAAPRCSRR